VLIAPLDVPCRRVRTDAGDALGREASMPARWRAVGTGIEPGEALHREALDAADVLLDVPAASCPSRRRPMECFGIGN
jgi:hypothetical protein